MKTIASLLILLCVLITVSEAQELSKVLIKGRLIDMIPVGPSSMPTFFLQTLL
ncbi:MAG: hypothetical protein Q8940_14500 [Bacteroidota bacterium]|nr:hypothetical protein [Bacteroidota bacterium]